MEVLAAWVSGEKNIVPFGGPDGGDGGNGGSIIIRGIDSLNTLADFRNKSMFTAENGEPGCSRK
jgi:Predicted GTPase